MVMIHERCNKTKKKKTKKTLVYLSMTGFVRET